MSILKFVNHHNRTPEEFWAYITDEAKTRPDLIIGLGIDPKYALEQMRFAASLWGKDENSFPTLHIIFSFDADVESKLCITAIKEVAARIGALFCKKHQGLAAIHTDKRNPHVHYLVSATGLATGTQFRQEHSLYSYKQAANQILAEYGLNPIPCFEGYDSIQPDGRIEDDRRTSPPSSTEAI